MQGFGDLCASKVSIVRRAAASNACSAHSTTPRSPPLRRLCSSVRKAVGTRCVWPSLITLLNSATRASPQSPVCLDQGAQLACNLRPHNLLVDMNVFRSGDLFVPRAPLSSAGACLRVLPVRACTAPGFFNPSSVSVITEATASSFSFFPPPFLLRTKLSNWKRSNGVGSLRAGGQLCMCDTRLIPN